MINQESLNAQIADLDYFGKIVELEFRNRNCCGMMLKRIGKDSANVILVLRQCENGDVSMGLHADRPQVVHPHHVVCVRVSDHYLVNVVDFKLTTLDAHFW